MGDCCDMEPVKAKECVGRCKKIPTPLWWLSCKFDGIKWGIKAFIRRHKKSPMEMWVENEVRLAIEREQAADREDCERRGKKYNPKDFSYGGEIYKSALRAYKSLLKDGHSGMSWAFTTSVLTRMMKHLPLTPLNGTDDEWHECGIRNADGVVDYQNCRKSSLFKHVHPDGTVTYNAVTRPDVRLANEMFEIFCQFHKKKCTFSTFCIISSENFTLTSDFLRNSSIPGAPQNPHT